MIKSHFRRPPSLSHGENFTTQGHCRSGIGRVFSMNIIYFVKLKILKENNVKNDKFHEKVPSPHLNRPRYCDESNFHHRRIIKIIIGMSSS